MNIDVSKAIQELIYEHTSVIVPGLGGFVTSPTTSSVDYVQGVIHPPSKQIDFNPNLVINDGILVHYIQKEQNVTFEEATTAVEQFVDSLKNALERHEFVEIPQVGSLYKDYEQKIRFTDAKTNFNTTTFGLPPVQFHPVERPRQPETPEQVAGAAKPKQPPAASGTTKTNADAGVAQASAEAPPAVVSVSRNWFQTLLPWLVLLSAVVIALSIYLMFGGGESTPASAALDKERLNVKPKPEATTPATKDDTSSPPQASNEQAASSPAVPAPGSSSNPQDSPADEERPPAADGLTKCYIIIHSFGKVDNARKFERQLKKAGYKPETRQEGSLYRVGILFSYSNQEELSEKVLELGRLFDSSPKVFEE